MDRSGGHCISEQYRQLVGDIAEEQCALRKSSQRQIRVLATFPMSLHVGGHGEARTKTSAHYSTHQLENMMQD